MALHSYIQDCIVMARLSAAAAEDDDDIGIATPEPSLHISIVVDNARSHQLHQTPSIHRHHSLSMSPITLSPPPPSALPTSPRPCRKSKIYSPRRSDCRSVYPVAKWRPGTLSSSTAILHVDHQDDDDSQDSPRAVNEIKPLLASRWYDSLHCSDSPRKAVRRLSASSVPAAAASASASQNENRSQ